MVPLSKSQVGQSIHTLDSLEPFFWSVAQIHPPISTCSKSVHCEPSKSLNKTVDLLSKNPNSLILTHTHKGKSPHTYISGFSSATVSICCVEQTKVGDSFINRWLGRSKPQQILGQQWPKKAQLGQTVASPGIAATQTGKAGQIQRPRHENGCRNLFFSLRQPGAFAFKELVVQGKRTEERHGDI